MHSQYGSCNEANQAELMPHMPSSCRSCQHLTHSDSNTIQGNHRATHKAAVHAFMRKCTEYSLIVTDRLYPCLSQETISLRFCFSMPKANLCGSGRLSSTRIWKLQRRIFGSSSKQSLLFNIAIFHHPNGIGGNTGDLIGIVAVDIIADGPIVKHSFSHL